MGGSGRGLNGRLGDLLCRPMYALDPAGAYAGGDKGPVNFLYSLYALGFLPCLLARQYQGYWSAWG